MPASDHLRGRHWLALNGKQRQFLRLYVGSTATAHNATRSYQAAYHNDHIPSCQRLGSRLLKNEHIQALLVDIEAEALEQIQVDANFVKAETLRLYRRAMGDEPFDQVSIETDPDTGEERVKHRERRDYDASTAHKALSMIGQHRDVQAFSVTVEHNHTHHLEQRLAARSRMIEGRAQVIDQVNAGQLPGLATDPAQVQADPLPASAPIPAGYVVGDDDNHEHGNMPGAGTEAPAEAHVAKRVHPSGGQSARGAHNEVPAREREGAKGK